MKRLVALVALLCMGSALTGSTANLIVVMDGTQQDVLAYSYSAGAYKDTRVSPPVQFYLVLEYTYTAGSGDNAGLFKVASAQTVSFWKDPADKKPHAANKLYKVSDLTGMLSIADLGPRSALVVIRDTETRAGGDEAAVTALQGTRAGTALRTLGGTGVSVSRMLGLPPPYGTLIADASITDFQARQTKQFDEAIATAQNADDVVAAITQYLESRGYHQ